MTATGSTWRNWARTYRSRPLRVERPRSTAAVQRAVVAATRAGVSVKVVGSSHSPNDSAVTRGVLLELDQLSGLISVDPASRRATFFAGTTLRTASRLLESYGLALENLGDTDEPTLGGALATATHGTGSAFAGLASQVVALTLVTGTGEIVEVDEDTPGDLLRAVTVSLGALGIVTEVTLRCVPAFVLSTVEKIESLSEVRASAVERSRDADHFEFFWFPHTTTVLTRTFTRHDRGYPRDRPSWLRRAARTGVLGNTAFRFTCALGAVLPICVPSINRAAARLMREPDRADRSFAVLSAKRPVRFSELEYAIDPSHLREALEKIESLIAERGWRITFPLEVRFAAADDDWLSPAYQRDVAYVAVHRYFREDPTEYFAGVEDVMRGLGGVPHWAKMHTLTSTELRKLHPRFDAFVERRNLWDPNGLFSNAYLRRVLG